MTEKLVQAKEMLPQADRVTLALLPPFDRDRDTDRNVIIDRVPGLLVHGTGGRYWAVRQFTNVLPILVDCWQDGEVLHLTYFFPEVRLENFPPQ